MTVPPVRRIVSFVIAVGVAAVCIRLGIWQLDRLEQRRVLNATIEQGLGEPPISLVELLDGTVPPDDLAYRRVTASGTYDTAHELLLYGRALDGRPGDHVLTPLVLSGDLAVLVDRGWVPSEPDRTTPVASPAAAPSGEVRVEGVLLPAEEGTAFLDDPTSPLVRSVNVEEIDARRSDLDLDLESAYLLLQTQAPEQTEGLPVPVPVPEPTEGPHLSYAIQWFSFATIALVGYGVLLRRDRRGERAAEEG